MAAQRLAFTVLISLMAVSSFQTNKGHVPLSPIFTSCPRKRGFHLHLYFQIIGQIGKLLAFSTLDYQNYRHGLIWISNI